MLFNLRELERFDKADKGNAGALSNRFYELHCQKVESIKDLTDLPSDNKIIFLWTINSFNAFTFIPFILSKHNKISELVITTYSINKRIIEAFSKLMQKNQIEKVDLFISDSIKYRVPRIYDELEAIAQANKNFNTHYAWNHSKIALVSTCDNFFIIEGSGNFSENAQFEQYVFLNNKEIYEFRKQSIYSSFHG